MTLQNLLGISLEAIEPDREQVTRLLAAAERNLTDARLAGLSNENRFDAAYKAIMQLAMLALHANGFRPLTSRPAIIKRRSRRCRRRSVCRSIA
ncbi:hypothetical protein ACRS8P_08350 [Burkholderia cenocepacia]